MSQAEKAEKDEQEADTRFFMEHMGYKYDSESDDENDSE